MLLLLLQDILSSLTYFYVSTEPEPLPGERTITITAADGQFQPITLVLFVEIRIINNNAPQLQFAGQSSVVYPESTGSPVLLPVGALMQPRIVDLDNNDIFMMERASVILVNPADGASEALGLSGSVSGITAQGESPHCTQTGCSLSLYSLSSHSLCS